MNVAEESAYQRGASHFAVCSANGGGCYGRSSFSTTHDRKLCHEGRRLRWAWRHLIWQNVPAEIEQKRYEHSR